MNTDKNIKMTKTSLEFINDSWEEKEKTERMINEEYYENIVDAKQFFINLGGTEKHTKKRTEKGMKVVKIVSISPDVTKKSIYEFEF